MSNQEQQFYVPEQHSSSEQSYQYYPVQNVDPREQQQQEMYGGPEYVTGRGEKLQPHPPRGKGFRAFWLVPIVLFFLIGGLSFGIFARHEQFNKGFDGPNFKQFDKGFGGFDHEQSYKVGDAPKLIVNDTAGTVHIHSSGDSSNAHTVTIIVNGGGRSEQKSLVQQVDGNTINIDTTQQGFGDNSVDLDITIPSTSEVQVKDGNGDVHVEGVTGNINVQTTQGSIDANNISGQVTLASTNGGIDVENGSLSGQSSLHSDNGDIRYNGSIDPGGSYKFDTLSGSIEVALPSNTAFRLDTNSANGHVENEFGSTNVGNGTHPPLTLSSANGSIHISKND